MKEYDLVVIGSGPAGEKAAVKAAYFGHTVALIEKENRYGGAGVYTGTLPSKTLKEAALYFSGKYDKGMYGVERTLAHRTTIKDFMFRKNIIIDSQGSEVHQNIVRHKIDILTGDAHFEDEHTVRYGTAADEVVYGKHIIIATGSFPFQPSNIPFDRKRIHDSDTILDLERFPSSMCIVGAGVIGCEYATIFAALGVRVYLVNHNDKILSFLDKEITGELIRQMKMEGIDIYFNTGIASIENSGDEEPLKIMLNDGNVLHTDMFLFAAGRSAATSTLKCENAGVQLGSRGVVTVDKTFQTSVPHIYAVGDVIGFPALASTSMEQGRVAVSYMFGLNDLEHYNPVLPYGIYTIPEVSMIGMTEEEAQAKNIKYFTGISRYRDMPRGKIMNAEEGFMKMIFEYETNKVLGVHIIGPLASELIHYGMSLVHTGAVIAKVLAEVFNFPTLHDLYKYACYDGLGNKSGHKIKK